MSSYKPTIAIAGINGTLGRHVLQSLLSEPFVSKINLPIRVISRNPDKIKANVPEVTTLNVEFHNADLHSLDSVTNVFRGADVVVNLVGYGVGQPDSIDHILLANAAAAAGSVKLYIPSEFGAVNDQSGPYNALFAEKPPVLAHIKALGLKPVVFATGPFAEFLLGNPAFGGINSPEAGNLTYYGDNYDVKISTTSMVDIGKSVAAVAVKDPATVPELIKINSAQVSPRVLAEAYHKVTGISLVPVHQPLAVVADPARKVLTEGVKSMADFCTGLVGYFYEGFCDIDGAENEFVSDGLFEFSSLETVIESVFKKR
ncbi:hypothetical protein DV113_002608 [Geotrichum candidum]|uniref:NmrA-like domain-containing protein n=1 Tax=Geotrichum candidum TaxID=1173061 RepID=A0A0J9XGG1_GEOCN|nr:hypothetical protein DV113_002608 [Geotrichum candidum]CDO56489.1 Conserved hypothetical protein [Geotrichum candidum]